MKGEREAEEVSAGMEGSWFDEDGRGGRGEEREVGEMVRRFREGRVKGCEEEGGEGKVG